MPAVFEYRHVELDKVGRGKRVLKPPGGETSDIFVAGGGSPGSTPGATTPTSGKSRRGSSDFGSAKSDRTQDRLFGGKDGPTSPGEEATPRRVVDRMKSSIFGAGGRDQPDKGPATSPVSPSKLSARRNPITGDLESPTGPRNGFHDSPLNGSLQHTPSPRVYKNPPGGKSSGIF